MARSRTTKRARKTDNQPATKGDVRLVKNEVGLLKDDIQAVKGDVHLLQNDVHLLKKDVRLLKSDMQAVKHEIKLVKDDVHLLKSDMQAVKGDIKSLKSDVAAVEAKLDNRFDELRDHFDAAVEVITDQLRGANTDEISALQDAKTDHEKRLTTIEQKVGLR